MTSASWRSADLILCTRPEEGPVDTVFSAGFESGDDGFTHSGAADEWERGTPATAAGGQARRAGPLRRGHRLLQDRPRRHVRAEQLAGPRVAADLARGPHAGRSTPRGRCGTSSSPRASSTSPSPSRRTAAPTPGRCSRGPEPTWWPSHGNPLVELGLAAGWGRHRADVSDYAGKTIRLRFHLDSDDNVQRRGRRDRRRARLPAVRSPSADGYGPRGLAADRRRAGRAGQRRRRDGALALESGPRARASESLDADGSVTYAPGVTTTAATRSRTARTAPA